MPRHQDYLGSLVGLGFDRGKLGDIFPMTVSGIDCADVFVYEDIAEYICGQLDRVGKVPVVVRQVSGDEEVPVREEEQEMVNVASLRLDVVAAASFRLSRGQVSAYIGAEKVFVNWEVCVDRGKLVKSGDMLAVRGLGRVRVGEVLGVTKKDRLRLTILRAKS